MNDEKTQAAVERLANTINDLDIYCDNVPTVKQDFDTVLAALDAANERAERAEAALRAMYRQEDVMREDADE